MPHSPYKPRPLPPGVGDQPDRTVAPTTTKDTTIQEVVPTYDELAKKVPTRRKPPKPRSKVRFPDGEPAVNMSTWHVDPARIASEIGFPDRP